MSIFYDTISVKGWCITFLFLAYVFTNDRKVEAINKESYKKQGNMKKSLLSRSIAKSKQGSSQIWTRSKQTLNIGMKDLSFL